MEVIGDIEGKKKDGNIMNATFPNGPRAPTLYRFLSFSVHPMSLSWFIKSKSVCAVKLFSFQYSFDLFSQFSKEFEYKLGWIYSNNTFMFKIDYVPVN